MKHCPLCESQYADETLRFCLQDGTPLADAAKQSAVDTIAFNNPVTSGKILQTEEMRVQFTDHTQNWNNPPVGKTAVQMPEKKSKSPVAVLMTAAAVLLILGVIGIPSGFYLNKQNETPDKAGLPPNGVEKKNATDTAGLPSESLEEKPVQSPGNSAPQSNADSETAKKEITDIVSAWKGLAESRNLAEYMSKYAETVEYYDKPGASLKEIRGEMQKLFSTYNDIDLTLTNMHVAVEADGLKATAIFDKEWAYENNKDLIEGKAHTELQFQKNGNEWKIVSEKHLKVYYTEN